MPIKTERRVSPKTHARKEVRRLLDWETTHAFLEVANRASLRAAATSLNQSVSSLKRSIDKLEETLGVALFTRHVTGMKLTADGKRILSAAKRMEDASFDLIRARDEATEGEGGDIRIAITEGIGSYWVAPRLSQFQDAHPKAVVDLQCGLNVANVSRLEADLAVQISPPSAKEVRALKLGVMHTMPYASRAYIERFGMPKSASDLVKHRIIMQTAEQIGTEEDNYRRFSFVLPYAHTAIRGNSSAAQFVMVASGVGIGMLATFASAVGAPVVPIDIGVHNKYGIWLVYHPDARRIPRVRAMMDWIIEVISPKRYPWFAERFVHPSEFGPSIDSAVGAFYKPLVDSQPWG